MVRRENIGNLRVHVAISHAIIILIEKLEKNVDMVGLVHVADVPGRHEAGTGEIDYTTIYRKLAELKYNRWIAMEYYPTEEPVASLKKTKAEALRALATV